MVDRLCPPFRRFVFLVLAVMTQSYSPYRDDVMFLQEHFNSRGWVDRDRNDIQEFRSKEKSPILKLAARGKYGMGSDSSSVQFR